MSICRLQPNLRDTIIICSFLLHFLGIFGQNEYVIDGDQGLGRRFDGVGAISGGGATSKLLVNYPEPQKSQILDYLFKPNWGASLHILKVEIGGDSQSSEGTESSHMHEKGDENYHRGYEWWLMKEAKKRNPSIKLYGLPWGFPGWLADGDWWPYRFPNRTADYICKWILGVKKVHGLDIDYIGIWNEKPYDIKYIKVLRHMLNVNGLSHVKIVAADLIGFDSWDIIKDIKSDPDLAKAVDIVGGHYTGTWTTEEAKGSGKALWSSEDYSTGDDEFGGGCMGRLLNQNYVNGLMTSTIAWNLIYSYYKALPYSPVGLMTAQQPWSGHYDISSPIWTTAHTTQFTQPGWYYLPHGSGVGTLKHGGSFVTMASPDRKNVTIVIETMNMEQGDFCLRVPQTRYKVTPQNVTLHLKGNLSKITSFEIWETNLGLGRKESTYFKHKGTIKVQENQITFYADINSVYTLTTLKTGRHGNFKSAVPPAKPYPHPYKDNFEGYPENGEAYNFAQQVGVFEIVQSGDRNHSRVMQQVVTQPPIFWCPLRQIIPLNVIGNYNWTDTFAQVAVYVPSVAGHTSGVYLAARVDKGGCITYFARGVFFFLHIDKGTVELTSDLVQTQSVKIKAMDLHYNTWYTLGLKVKGTHVTCSVNGRTIFDVSLTNLGINHGFSALGTENFGIAQFDDFVVDVV